MQQNSYKDQLCTRSLWVCVSKDELITLQTAKQTAHCTSCLFSCMFVIKRQLLSALLYMPLALLSIEIKGNKRDFKSIPCHPETLLGDTYYNNLSRRLSLVGHMNIKFWHTKINESSWDACARVDFGVQPVSCALFLVLEASLIYERMTHSHFISLSSM